MRLSCPAWLWSFRLRYLQALHWSSVPFHHMCSTFCHPLPRWSCTWSGCRPHRPGHMWSHRMLRSRLQRLSSSEVLCFRSSVRSWTRLPWAFLHWGPSLLWVLQIPPPHRCWWTLPVRLSCPALQWSFLRHHLRVLHSLPAASHHMCSMFCRPSPRWSCTWSGCRPHRPGYMWSHRMLRSRLRRLSSSEVLLFPSSVRSWTRLPWVFPHWGLSLLWVLQIPPHGNIRL